MPISYHKLISGYKYTEYNKTTLTQNNVIILTESQNYFLFFIIESVPNDIIFIVFFQRFSSGKCDTRIPIKY